MYNIYIEQKKKKIEKDKHLIEEKENMLRKHRQSKFQNNKSPKESCPN